MDPYNKVGKHILAWCKRHNMTIGYACATKKQRECEVFQNLTSERGN